jgi:hypothetical protein
MKTPLADPTNDSTNAPNLGEDVAKGARELAMGATHFAQEAAATRELTEREVGIARRIDFVTRMMDNAVRVPGTDFHIGLDPMLGLLPGYGDAISAAISLYVLVEAIRLGAPPNILARMAGNVAFDLAVGYIPGIGDLFDTIFKANSRNASLIRTEILGLPAPKTSRFSILDIEPESVVERPARVAELEPIDVAEFEPIDIEVLSGDPEAPNRAPSPRVEVAPAAAQIARPRPRVLVRETSTLQKAFGYTLVAGLISLFLLPWAILAYFVFT